MKDIFETECVDDDSGQSENEIVELPPEKKKHHHQQQKKRKLQNGK